MSKKIITKSRKHLTFALVCAMCLTLLVGSFAFFTDRADVSADATAGNLAIALSENGNGTTSITEQLKLGGQYGNITNGATLDNWNPGDIIPFSYTVTNSGNKAIRAEETVKSETNGLIEKTLDRDHIWLARTPQVFGVNIYRTALAIAAKDHIAVTDDCALVEHIDYRIRLVECSKHNLKITTAEDALLATAILAMRNTEETP